MATTALPLDKTYSGEDIEIKEFILHAFSKSIVDINVVERMTDGEITMDMSGTPQIEVTIHDMARELVSSGVLWDSEGRLRAMDVVLDGVTWRLDAAEKQTADLVMTFILREVAWLKAKFGPRKAASRAKVTRAQFIFTLVRAVKQEKIPVRIPEIDIKQPIAGQKDRRKQVKKDKGNEDKAAGFDLSHKVAGLGKGELENVSVFMDVANGNNPAGKKASQRAVMAGIVAGFGESGWRKSAAEKVYGTHKGVFQSDQIPASDLAAQSYHFLFGGRSFLAGGAQKYVKDHPYATLGEVAAKVEISDGSTAYYNTFRSKAKKVYDAYHGGTGNPGSVTLYKRYEYRVQGGRPNEEPESYWDAIQRLAKEVGWSAFFTIVRGKVTFYFISDYRLMNQRATYEVSEDTPGVDNIDFQDDYGKRVQQCTITCRIDRWAAPPGNTVIVNGLNKQGSKKWLVETINRKLYSAEATITVRRPQHQRKEPAPEPYTKDTSPQDNTDKRHAGQIHGKVEGLHADLTTFLQDVAGRTNEKIEITSGYDKTGHVADSNHHDGWAADIGVGGDARSSAAALKKGNNICIAVLMECGMSRIDARKALGGPRTSFNVNSTWRGFSVEIGWRTTEGGNHFNHVHVGFDKGPNGRRAGAADSSSKLDTAYHGGNP